MKHRLPTVEHIDTEVFAELPSAFRKVRPPNDWIKVQRGSKHADCVFEGPCFDTFGNLYVSDIPWGRIFRIDPTGEFEQIADYDGEPNGMAVRPDGMLVVADMRNGILLLNPSSGNIEPVLPRAEIEGFKAVSDLVFSRSGDLYFTDQGLTGMHDPTGRVYKLDATNRLTCLVRNVPSPNGIVIDDLDQVLYIAATRANAVWRAPLLASGVVVKAGVHVQLSGGHGPDGLALDSEGNLAIAHVGAGRVVVVDPHGDPLAMVYSCTGRTVTNTFFSPPGNPGWIYMTEAESGTILRARWPYPGQPLWSHSDAGSSV